MHDAREFHARNMTRGCIDAVEIPTCLSRIRKLPGQKSATVARRTTERARRDRREGKSASTQAGEFVREEIASGLELIRIFRCGGSNALSAKSIVL
jgi:hypothetical protein